MRAYRMLMPAFDKHATPSGMGAIAEALRTTNGAIRSDHPQSSFAAIGPEAGPLMAGHRLESHLGEGSPPAKLYERRAQVLMIGVGYKYCTALRLAEYRYAAKPPMQTYTGVIAIDGKHGWAGYQDAVLDDSDFDEIGKYLSAEVVVSQGRVGHAECRLIPLCETVDFAGEWMTRYRWARPELMRLGDLCKL